MGDDKVARHPTSVSKALLKTARCTYKSVLTARLCPAVDTSAPQTDTNKTSYYYVIHLYCMPPIIEENVFAGPEKMRFLRVTGIVLQSNLVTYPAQEGSWLRHACLLLPLSAPPHILSSWVPGGNLPGDGQ